MKRSTSSSWLSSSLQWWILIWMTSCFVFPMTTCTCAIHETTTTTTITSTTSSSRPPNVIIVGGSSGMGKATAHQVLQQGGTVLLVSRSMTKLEQAKQELACPERTLLASVDITQESQIQSFAKTLPSPPVVVKSSSSSPPPTTTTTPKWDGLVITAAGRAVHGPVSTLETNTVREFVDSKVWGAYMCAKYLHSHLQPNGAIVFCAGILNRRPGIHCVPLALSNGALEGITKALALEWGPQLRVNCLSPGFCNTERFDHIMDYEKKQAMLQHTAASLPLQKVGQPSDMGEAIYYLLTAPFCTGVVLDVDGGHGIRQYANPINDPMRQS